MVAIAVNFHMMGTSVVCDENVILEKEFQVQAKPHTTTKVKLEYDLPKEAKYGAFVEIYMDMPKETSWCEKGHNVAWAQFELPVERVAEVAEQLQKIEVEEAKRYIVVNVEGKSYKFDKALGTITSMGVDIDVHAEKGEVKFMHRSMSEETNLDLKLKQDIDEIPRFAVRVPLIS